ncbi:MAG: pyridoxamine 5'-phosphate oxidase family protein [Clostridiales bacterium]|nr:pyridoxamine 5'-phosphate oxidase family protein [Clostridiales bacterium]
MFRQMRRKKQVLTKEDCELVLERGTSGVLAVQGDGGYPYAVPLSYVYTDGKIVFHCAKQGHKLDAIAQNDKVSFCVIDLDDIQPERYTTYFRSVIAFGRARVLEEEAEKRAAIEALAAKYTPDDPEGRKQEIEREYRALCVVAIEIDHLSGKEAIELVKKKER